jgi:signal transduction histidine kinase
VAAAALLALVNLGANLWTYVSLSRLSASIEAGGRDSEDTIAATSALTTALEREDDALLVLLGQPGPGRNRLAEARQQSDQALERLRQLLTTDEERRAAGDIDANVADYRETADRLVARAPVGSLEQYQLEANPRLRLAVTAAAHVRDRHVEEARSTTILARTGMARVRDTLPLIALVSLALSLAVALHLARTVLKPLRRLAHTADKLREGHAPGPVDPTDDDVGHIAQVLHETTTRLNDLRRMDERRAELIAVASHELRTPVTTLRMSLQMLHEASAELSPRSRELVATALGGVEQLGETVDEMLDMTRIEAGRLRLTLEPVDLAALAGVALERWRPRAQELGLTLVVRNDPDLPLARGDRSRLRVVLDNLLSNALKYTPHGGRVEVAVEVSRLDAAEETGPILQIAVTDSGQGVPLEFRTRVFDKFFRVEHHRPGSEESPQGTGIGLYLCKEIVELHGGTIRCEASSGGHGTRIAVRLHAL